MSNSTLDEAGLKLLRETLDGWLTEDVTANAIIAEGLIAIEDACAAAAVPDLGDAGASGHDLELFIAGRLNAIVNILHTLRRLPERLEHLAEGDNEPD